MDVRGSPPDETVWYAAYGSNLSLARLRCYIEGGQPAGNMRHYPGCRNTNPPRAIRPLEVDGMVHFAGESRAWGGGMAFYDPTGAGTVLMRAYLVTVPQLVDVAAQEMHRDPATVRMDSWRLDQVVTAGRWSLGSGRYETVYCVGELDHRPVLTISHGPRRPDLRPNAASAAYLGWVMTGLHEAHALSPDDIAGYLRGCDGIGWTRTELARLAGSVLDTAVAAQPG